MNAPQFFNLSFSKLNKLTEGMTNPQLQVQGQEDTTRIIVYDLDNLETLGNMGSSASFFEIPHQSNAE